MKRLILLLLVIPILTGCSFVSLERQIYPICMSVDLSENGWIVGVQAPRAEAGENASYEILSATGDTFHHALRTLSASTPYPLHFGQIRLCLLGYPLCARTEMRGLLRTILELPTMRPDCYVSIALGSAMDVMQYQKPDFGMRLSTHLRLMLDRMQKEHLLPESTLSACVRELSDGRSDMLIGVSAVNRRLLPEEHKSAPGSGGSEEPSAPAAALGEPWSDALLPPDVMAGLIPHTSQNPVEYLGAAALSGHRVSGVLTADQVQLALRLRKEAKMRVLRDGDVGRLILQIELPKGSALLQNTEAVYGLMETLQALGSDPLLFGCVCSMGFGTDEAWERYDFRSRYPEAEVRVVE